MPPITTSIFEFFKIGPGPSSSHTIGPMRAGYNFTEFAAELPKEVIDKAEKVEVHLYGSLSATGRGHGTHRAALAGLLGQNPATCPSDFLDGLLKTPGETYQVPLPGKTVPITGDDIIYDDVMADFPFTNTMVIQLKDAGGGVLAEREYYSPGGGFIQWKGWSPPERGDPAHPYKTMAEVRKHLQDKGISLEQLMIENEQDLTGASRKAIDQGLDQIMHAMDAAVDNGLNTEGVMPGVLGLHRKAPDLYRRLRAREAGMGRLMLALDAYAFAAAEENSVGHILVTAPTLGSAGVLPAVIRVLGRHLHIDKAHLRRGMLAAALVGFLCKHNASIAGAEVGCQGEIGVATSMAAALIAEAKGFSPKVVENAAETGLEHQLGLTCDPVGGEVQIPCIERNAVGAVKAYNAFLIASMETAAFHLVDLDKVIWVMAETGKDMSRKYKETSEGGLALSLAKTHC
jgi:L-serine dehydratase